jgi:two-component system cell cycle response regulator DivK
VLSAHQKEADALSKVILVVEDFNDLRKIMCEMLKHNGFSILEACNGKEAVEMAISGRPDIILMDIAMPEMNGIEATRAIRENEELSSVPIIAITAFGDDYQAAAISAGCVDVMQKPIRIANLLPRLNKWLDPIADSAS